MIRLRAAVALVAAALLQLPAAAEDILIAAEYEEFTRLSRLIIQWERQTGHSVLWLPPIAETIGATPDLYYMPAHELASLAASVELQNFAQPSGTLAPAPLAAVGKQAGNDTYQAIVQTMQLPVLWYRIDAAAAANARFEADQPDWVGIARFAEQLDDPVSGVRGFCPPGRERHASIVRSMIAEQGKSWLAADQEEPKLADSWLDAAARYARLLAAASVPQSADIAYASARDMFSAGRCSIWLGEANPVQTDSQLTALPVPGAIAFAWPSMRVFALDARSENSHVAADFAWFASTGREPAADAVAAESIVADNPSALQALQAMLNQPAAPAQLAGVDADVLDELAASGLRKIILGLEPPAEAFIEALPAEEN